MRLYVVQLVSSSSTNSTSMSAVFGRVSVCVCVCVVETNEEEEEERGITDKELEDRRKKNDVSLSQHGIRNTRLTLLEPANCLSHH